MAGKDIYIGSMLEKLQDSMVALEDNVAASADAQINKLNELIGVLNNIAVNTGITILQNAFTGDKLSAVTIKSPDALDISPTSGLASNGAFTLTHTSKANASIVFHLDLTNFNTLEGNYLAAKANMSRFIINIDGTTVHTSAALTTAEVAFSVDVSAYTGICEITITANGIGPGSTAMQITSTMRNLKLVNDITEYPLFSSCDTLAYSNNKLKMSSNNYGYAYGFVNYTGSITDTVALWNAIIFNGELDGIKLSIVDSKGNVIKELLPTTNISDIKLYDFYIKYEFINPEEEVSGVIFRYC